MSDRMERGRAAAAEMERRLRPLIEAQPREHQAVLMAALERGAAARYRSWAEAAASESERRGLLDCALREEQMAIQASAEGVGVSAWRTFARARPCRG